MYYRSRYYDAEAGRFLSEDSFAGTARSPSTLQRFSYVANDPINHTDPSGHFPLGIGIGVLAAVSLFVTAGAFLSERPDLWAHFLGGFALASILTAIGVGRFGPLGLAVAYILLISVAINILLEETYFNTGGFDQADFWAQNLGVAVAVAIFLLLFYLFQPIARLAADTLLWFVAAALLVGLWAFVVRAIGEARAYALRRGLGV